MAWHAECVCEGEQTGKRAALLGGALQIDSL